MMNNRKTWIIVFMIFALSLTSTNKLLSFTLYAKAETDSLGIPFDKNMQKVPLQFTGHGIVLTHQTVENIKKSTDKSEYETTEQYQQRLASFSKSNLWGLVNLDSLLAFVVKPETEYDADTQTLSVSIDASGDYVKVKRVSDTSQAVMQNVFGARSLVNSLTIEFFNLHINNIKDFRTTRKLSKYEIRSYANTAPPPSAGSPTFFYRISSVKPHEAKIVRDEINAIFVVALRPPYIEEMKTSGTSGTSGNSAIYNYTLEVKLLEVWCYHTQTGAIILKQTPQSPKEPLR